MSTYYVDLGDGERIEVVEASPEAVIREALSEAADYGALTDSFTAQALISPEAHQGDRKGTLLQVESSR